MLIKGEDIMKDHTARIEALDGAWQAKMPCNECRIKDMCKSAFKVKRPECDPEVFDIQLKCKKFAEYNRPVPLEEACNQTGRLCMTEIGRNMLEGQSHD